MEVFKFTCTRINQNLKHFYRNTFLILNGFSNLLVTFVFCSHKSALLFLLVTFSSFNVFSSFLSKHIFAISETSQLSIYLSTKQMFFHKTILNLFTFFVQLTHFGSDKTIDIIKSRLWAIFVVDLIVSSIHKGIVVF